MDIEDLLADDGQFKDEGLDDLEVDEVALLGSSEDEEDEANHTSEYKTSGEAIEGADSSYLQEDSALDKTSYDDFEAPVDDSDVLEVDVDAELESFGVEDLKDDAISSEPPRKLTRYQDNLIPVTLVSNPKPSPKRTELLRRISLQDVALEDKSDESTSSKDHGMSVLHSDILLDEESDEENVDDDRRGRFKSERSGLSLHTSKHNTDIPDSLDSVLSVEETSKAQAYLENQQRRKMFHRTRGQFRGKVVQAPRMHVITSTAAPVHSFVPQVEPPAVQPVRVTAPKKIHINPHFRRDPNSALAAIRASQTLALSATATTVAPVSAANTVLQYSDSNQSNYTSYSSTYSFPENNRYQQTVPQFPPPLLTTPVAPVNLYHSAVPPPNLQAPPPSSMPPPPTSNYMHPNSANDYSTVVGNMLPPPHSMSQGAVSNPWIQPQVSISPSHQLLENQQKYNFSTGVVGFSAQSDNSFGMSNYQNSSQPPDLSTPPPNLFVPSHANSSFEEQWANQSVAKHYNVRQPPPSVRSTNVQVHSTLQVVNQNQYQNNGQRFLRVSSQKSPVSDQKRTLQLQTHSRKLVKRSTNFSISNQVLKKHRFEDNQRKNLSPIVPKQNSNIKQIPLVENLPTAKSSAPALEDEDEETREYRKMVELQKREREAYLKQKEARRKIMAAQRLQELRKRKAAALTQVQTVAPKNITTAQNVVKQPAVQVTPPQGNVIQLTKAAPPKNTGMQQKVIQVKTQAPKPTPTPTVKKIDLRSKINTQVKENLTQITSVKNPDDPNVVGKIKLVQKNVISLKPAIAKTQAQKPTGNNNLQLNKTGMNAANKPAVSKVISLKSPKSATNQRPMRQNINQSLNAVRFHANRFSTNRFANRPLMAPPPPMQEPMFHPVQGNVIRNPQFQNQRFNVNAGPRMPFPPPANIRAPNFYPQPQMLQRPNSINFNPRFPGQIPDIRRDEFLMHCQRMPPPNYGPPQTFQPQLRFEQPRGMRMSPPRHRMMLNQKAGGSPQRFRGNFRKHPVNNTPRTSSVISKPVSNICEKPDANKVTVKQEDAPKVALAVQDNSLKQEVISTVKTVIVSNLSSSTSEVQLKKLSTAIGPIENIQYMATERKATITFKNPSHASQFQTKYQRYMLDLSLIEVALQKPS